MVWSGLGMGMFSSSDPAINANYIRDCLRAGQEIRIDIPTYTDSSWMARSKASVIQAVNLGAKVTWGVSSNTPTTITSSNFAAYKQAIKDAADWAQANGVWEFQLGNEEENHVDGSTVTASDVTAYMIGAGATDAQNRFSGNISYAVSPNLIPTYVSGGKGGLDKISFNIYSDSTPYWTDSSLQNIYSAFGTDAWISEFAPNSTSLDTYSTNEEKQLIQVKKMYDRIIAIGFNRVYFFCYNDTNFGAYNTTTGFYRLLWNILTSKRRYFINV